MRGVTYAGLALALAGAALFLLQLWAQTFPADLFVKLAITDGVLLGVVVIVGFVLRERGETERLKNQRDLD